MRSVEITSIKVAPDIRVRGICVRVGVDTLLPKYMNCLHERPCTDVDWVLDANHA